MPFLILLGLFLRGIRIHSSHSSGFCLAGEAVVGPSRAQLFFSSDSHVAICAMSGWVLAPPSSRAVLYLCLCLCLCLIPTND